MESRDVYRVCTVVDTVNGFKSQQITSHSIFFVIELTAVYIDGNGNFVSANLNNDTVLYSSTGILNLNLTSQTTANSRALVTLVYTAN